MNTSVSHPHWIDRVSQRRTAQEFKTWALKVTVLTDSGKFPHDLPGKIDSLAGDILAGRTTIASAESVILARLGK